MDKTLNNPEVQDAFVAILGAEPNETPAQTVKRHLKRFARDVVAAHRRRAAMAAAEATLAVSAPLDL